MSFNRSEMDAIQPVKGSAFALGDHSSAIDDDVMSDAKAAIAKALVKNQYRISWRFSQAVIWLKWALGDEAEDIIAYALDLKIRQNSGSSRVLVKALQALAMEEMKMKNVLSTKSDK